MSFNSFSVPVLFSVIDCLKVFKIVFLISLFCCSHIVLSAVLPQWFATLVVLHYTDDSAVFPAVVILRALRPALFTTGELVMCLWPSSVPCREMVLKVEMCWTQQARDGVVEDTSEPQPWKEHSLRLDGLIVCEVLSWEEQEWPGVDLEAWLEFRCLLQQVLWNWHYELTGWKRNWRVRIRTYGHTVDVIYTVGKNLISAKFTWHQNGVRRHTVLTWV